jgi:two-component system, NarL family, nitrate/nitrite response regulator NarL
MSQSGETPAAVPPKTMYSVSARAAAIVIADDEWMFRASLRQLLTAPPTVIKEAYGVDVGAGFNVVGEAGNGADAIAIVRSAAPDLLLLDLDMPRMSGLDVVRELQEVRGRMNTLILAGDIDKSELLKAVQLGVRAIVLKDAATEVLFEAIVSVLMGRSWLDQTLAADLMEIAGALASQANPATGRRPFDLTPRERDVLNLVVAGCSNKEIARACAVSEETIKHHLTRIFAKVGASNRLELALLATESGLVTGSGPAAPAVQTPDAPGVLRPVITSG